MNTPGDRSEERSAPALEALVAHSMNFLRKLRKTKLLPLLSKELQAGDLRPNAQGVLPEIAGDVNGCPFTLAPSEQRGKLRYPFVDGRFPRYKHHKTPVLQREKETGHTNLSLGHIEPGGIREHRIEVH